MRRRGALRVDAAIAVAVAILVIVLSPGLAVSGMIAVLMLALCAVSFAWRARPSGRRRGRRRERSLPRRPGR